MSQREIKFLMESGTSSPSNKKRTRSASVCSETSEMDSQDLPRVTRRSTRISSVQAETKLETRSGSPRTRKSVQLENEVHTPIRTRRTSVTSTLSDASELDQTEGESSRRTSISNPMDESVQENPLKRSSNISSITSEIESRPTPLRSSRKSALIAKDKFESLLTPRKTRASSLPKEPVSEQTSKTPSVVAKNKVLDVVKHKDSPYKSVSGRRSLRLSNSFVDADESGKIEEVEEENDGASIKLSTKEYEEIEFSTDEEGEKKSKSSENKRRKSVLPPKNDHLLTINEDDDDEIEEIIIKSVEKSPSKNASKPYASPKKNRLLQHINQENQSESVSSMSNANEEKIGSPVQTTSHKRKFDQLETNLTKESSPSTETKENRQLVEKNQLEVSNTITEHQDENDKSNDKRPLKKRKSGELVPTPLKETPSLNQTKSIHKWDENVKDVVNENRKKRKSKDGEQTSKKKISSTEKSAASDIQSTEYEEITLDDEEENEDEPIVEKVVEKSDEKKKSPMKSSSEIEESPRTSINKNDKPQEKKKLSLTNNSKKQKNPKRKSEETIELNHAQRKYLSSKDRCIAKLVDMNNNLLKEIENETKLSDEANEGQIRCIKLLKIKLKMQNKKIKYLQKLRAKKLKKMIKSNRIKQMTSSNTLENICVTNKKDDAKNVTEDAINKTSLNSLGKKKEAVQKSKTVKNDTDQQISVEKKLEKILAKKEKRRQLWLEKMAQKKLARKLKKREEFEEGKAERRLFFEKRAKMKNFEKAKKKKKKNKKRDKTNKGPVVEGGGTVNGKSASDNGQPSFSLEDIVAKLEVFTSSSKENIPRSATKGDGDGGKLDVRGQAKSGRFWKETKQKFSTMVKTPGLRRPHSEKEKLRLDIQKNKELTRHILDTQAKAKEEHRLRRIENIRRREENAKKAEIVQVIKNPAKLKRMKKKQLRMIEKRDTLPIIEKRKQTA